MFIEFIISLKWLWIILLIMIYVSGRHMIKKFDKLIDMITSQSVKSIKINDEVLDELDNLIKEIITEYQILQLNAKDVPYINSKLEQEIVSYVTDSIAERISTTLLQKLELRYNPLYIPKLIGTRTYYAVLDFVLAFNADANSALKSSNN